MRHPVTTSLFFLAFLMAAARVPAAAPDGDVDRVLALDEAPFGVVFEVVSGDPDALNAIIPRVSRYEVRRPPGAQHDPRLSFHLEAGHDLSATIRQRVLYLYLSDRKSAWR